MTYNPRNLVRVKDSVTGAEYSVENVDKDRHEVLKDRDAVDSFGDPLPAKPSRSKGGPAKKAPAKKAAAKKAESEPPAADQPANPEDSRTS